MDIDIRSGCEVFPFNLMSGRQACDVQSHIEFYAVPAIAVLLLIAITLQVKK